MTEELADLKQRARATWASGAYDTVAELILSVGGRVVAATTIDSGDRVLDVACGSGNATIPAAQTGAEVVGLDLTPELFEAGRRRAAAAGVEIEWVAGDAEELPFEDASFDVVVSTFGCMFAPRHQVTAAEMARVLRPGGRLGVCSWTPEGSIGDFFRTVGAHLPPPPDIAQPPLLWGTEDHVRELFARTVDLDFTREIVELRFDSVEHAVTLYEETFGPIVAARAMLAPQGKWPALREDLVDLFERHTEPSGDGGLVYAAEYLVAKGTRTG